MTDSDLDALLAVQSRSYRAAGEGLRRSWPEDDALDRDGLRALIDDVHYGVLRDLPPGRPCPRDAGRVLALRGSALDRQRRGAAPGEPA